MKIAADLEGPIADPHTLWVQAYNACNGTNYTLEDIDSWDFYKKPDAKFKITEKEFFDGFKKIWCEDWERIPPAEENICETLKSLSQRHKIEILTKTVAGYSAKGKRNVLAWLRKCEITYRRVIFLPISAYNKMDFDYDLFVDDDPHLAPEADKLEKRLLLYDRPWNQGIKDNSYVKRIHSLAEIPKLI